MTEIEYEHDWMVRAVNDETKDYYIRLARLIEHKHNAIELKKMEQFVDGRKIIELGAETDTVSKPLFLGRAQELNVEVELY